MPTSPAAAATLGALLGGGCEPGLAERGVPLPDLPVGDQAEGVEGVLVHQRRDLLGVLGIEVPAPADPAVHPGRRRVHRRHPLAGAGGYLRTGRTLRELATAIGVDPQGLQGTVADNNRFARQGVDEEFGKGESVFGHQYGDPEHRPNVNLGPLEKGPFYALAVVPTPLGTALGLRTNPDAQVLTESGEPIPGLYACGNAANSVMASEYPGAGCQVGAGLTFGYVAARHAANQSGDGSAPSAAGVTALQ